MGGYNLLLFTADKSVFFVPLFISPSLNYLDFSRHDGLLLWRGIGCVKDVMFLKRCKIDSMNNLDNIAPRWDALKCANKDYGCAGDCIECVVYGIIFTMQNTLAHLYHTHDAYPAIPIINSNWSFSSKSVLMSNNSWWPGLYCNLFLQTCHQAEICRPETTHDVVEAGLRLSTRSCSETPFMLKNMLCPGLGLFFDELTHGETSHIGDYPLPWRKYSGAINMCL